MSGRVLLSADQPTVTLDRRQSAIGSLAFEVAGPGNVSAVWELQDGTGGLVGEAAGVWTSPEYGRRSIVELTGDRLVVGLRHVRELRRLVILVDGFSGNDPQRLVVLLFDGSSVEVSVQTSGGPVVAALAIYQVAGELVLRREAFAFADGPTIAAAYGVAQSWLPPVGRR